MTLPFSNLLCTRFKLVPTSLTHIHRLTATK
jgi:hypothetical protein